MRTRSLFVACLAAASTVAACSGAVPPSPHVDTGADEKALLYNLIGRWYPEQEIDRLSDRTLTPDQWCEREPSVIFVNADRVQVRCEKGAEMSAMIATAHREEDGTVSLLLRVKEGSPLSRLRFLATGPKAVITGSPCFEGKAAKHARFPEFEILSREILGGRRCAQITKAGEPQLAEPSPRD